jgi:acylphosphatase
MTASTQTNVTPAATSAARLLRVRGHVQRVGYRRAFAREAVRLGLRGWVRNRGDGTVEALVHGDPDDVARMIHWAGLGPRAAQVDRVEVEEADDRPDGFAIAPTA